METKIALLTYCHTCLSVFTDKHLECPSCGSGSVLICDPGTSIQEWIKADQKLESVKDKQCGCCDYFLY